MDNTYKQELLYYAISLDFSQEPGMIKIGNDLHGFNEYRFSDGKIIGDWPDGIVFTFKGIRVDDYWKPRLGWNIISDRAKLIFIEKDIKGVQFLPVRVENIQTKISYQFWELNVYHSIVSLKSKYINNLDIFRIRNPVEGVLPEIYISSRLKQYLEHAGTARGFGFRLISSKVLNKFL